MTASFNLPNAVLRPGWDYLPAKRVLKEITDLSPEGNELLLSVSEYYGVAPRNEKIDASEHLTRADSLVGYKRCRPGDIVMNIMLAWKRALGVSAYDGIVSPAYAVFRPDTKLLHSRFAHYLLRDDTYVSEFKKLSTGVIDSRLRLYPEVFLAMPLSLPRMEEQECIANFLDDKTTRIDALIAEKERLLETLDTAREAHAFHLATGGLAGSSNTYARAEEWLRQVPSHWPVPKLGYFAEVGNGSTPRREVEEYWLNGTVPWITSTEVNDRVIRETAQLITPLGVSESHLRLVRPGSAIVGLIGQGPTRGMTAQLLIPATLSQNVAYVSVNRPDVLDEYLVVAMTGMYSALRFLSDGSGGAQGAMNCDTLRNFRLPVPPEKEQVEIIDAFRKREAALGDLQAHAREHVERLREYRSSLISAAVTGQLDLAAQGMPT